MSATPDVPRRERLQRSELAVPATSERFFVKACASDADVVFLDLEDAVAIRLKDEARHRAIEAINGLDWGDRTLAVRINGLDTPWALRDLVDVVGQCPRLDLVLLPKAGSAFDVRGGMIDDCGHWIPGTPRTDRRRDVALPRISPTRRAAQGEFR